MNQKSLDKKKPGWRKMTADDLRRGIDLSKTISGFRVIETKSDKKKTKSSEGKGIKEIKYKKVKFCANCLTETAKCKCGSKLVEVMETCGNCDEPLEETWSFCPVCGYEVKWGDKV